MLNEVGAIAGEHIDDRNLNHRIAAGLKAHRGTGHVDKYLTGKGGVVDAHVELQALVLGLAADTFAYEVDTMTHVAHIVNALNLENVGFVAGEVGICLDGGCHLLEFGTIFELYIYHTAMDALAKRNGH